VEFAAECVDVLGGVQIVVAGGSLVPERGLGLAVGLAQEVDGLPNRLGAAGGGMATEVEFVMSLGWVKQ